MNQQILKLTDEYEFIRRKLSDEESISQNLTKLKAEAEEQIIRLNHVVAQKDDDIA